MHPKTRKSNLHRTELDGQAILYDEQGDQVHLLDATTALVYDLADGTHSIDDMTHAVADRIGVTGDADLVKVALEELSSAGLLEDAEWKDQDAGVDRRALVRRLAIAGAIAVALPVIMTITAPQAAAQVTG